MSRGMAIASAELEQHGESVAQTIEEIVRVHTLLMFDAWFWSLSEGSSRLRWPQLFK